MSSGDDVRLGRFVTNLYYGALQRDPTAQELQNSVNQLAAAGAQSQSQLLAVASQIARSLFTSTNYETSPYRSDIQYVADLYYAYLQRGPDDGGLGWWTGQVPGSGRANVCNAFEASSEFATLVATLYGTATSDNERTEHFVNNFYLGAYGRNATASELQQQRDALNAAAAQGPTQVQTQAESFGRSLFAAQVNDAALSNTQFVTNLYEGFLQRGPDAGGLGWWSGQASVGSGRQNVLNAFATCGPFHELAVTLYREAFWLVTDHLGTPRMIFNKSGSLAGVKRHDYLPFGEEIFAGTGGRTPQQGYSSDSVRQKFTSYEHDVESGLEYAQARYYSSIQGRFTSPDPLLGSGAVIIPQSWNRYSYCLNNPLTLVDPEGLRWYHSAANYDQPVWYDEDRSDLQTWTDYNYYGGEGVGWVHLSRLTNDFSTGYLSKPDASDAFIVNEVIAEMGEEIRRTWNYNYISQDAKRFLNDPLGRGGLGDPAFMMLGVQGSFSSFWQFGRKAATASADDGLALITRNKQAGDGLRDEIAALLREAGRETTTEVSKFTPFGRRVIDIEVSNAGQVLGGIETKFGSARYGAAQRAKDMYLRLFQDYPVNVVRQTK